MAISKKAVTSKRKLSVLKKESHLNPFTTFKWFSTGGLLGYFVLHPCIMIIANSMFVFGPDSGFSVRPTIFSVFMRSFSLTMLPWSFSFALLSALLGAYYGYGRQMLTALRESEKKFRELSITDDLTGIHNSRHLFRQLKAEIERSSRYKHPLSLLIIDLDNFKQYNDDYGHIAGDKVLARSGEILRRSLRKTDSAYRYGGEEFTVILPESTGKESLHFAERIRQAFEKEAFSLRQERNLAVTVSIGVAQYIPGEEITALIKRADINLYTAKNKGKNRICFSH
jgi:diguanylate cyclase (GGDEF)-like protein